MDWRRYGPEEIEAQFNPRRSVLRFRGSSGAACGERRARTALDGRLDVPTARARCTDRHVPGARVRDAPVHVFFHGGYWRAGQGEFAHIAKTLVGAGICAVIANYDLCPVVTLDGTVSPARDRLDLAPCARTAAIPTG